MYHLSEAAQAKNRLLDGWVVTSTSSCRHGTIIAVKFVVEANVAVPSALKQHRPIRGCSLADASTAIARNKGSTSIAYLVGWADALLAQAM